MRNPFSFRLSDDQIRECLEYLASDVELECHEDKVRALFTPAMKGEYRAALRKLDRDFYTRALRYEQERRQGRSS